MTRSAVFLLVLGLLACSSWADEPQRVRIVLCGDSTVASGSGWGDAFAKLLPPQAECFNQARSGRSSKSYFNEGHWTKALAQKPAFVLIQFGHNDQPGKGPERETDPATTFRDNLRRYIAEAREIGAMPILVTPLSRRIFGDDRKITSTLTPYADAAIAVAGEQKVPLLDLHARSIEQLNQLGPTGAAAFNPSTKDGSTDRTHLNEKGAAATAQLVADELRKVAPEIARRVGLAAAASPRRPNVVIFLADDMGYSDLGCYGGEIRTPNLDGLAKNGLRFTQFYNTARCWPTRGALLTGYYAQQIRRDTVPGVRSGGGGVRPAWAKLLPELLKPLGYRSYHSGKWHVDGPALAGGFDHSYLIQDAGRFFSPQVHLEDDVKLPAVEHDTGYYSTTAIADHAIKYLKDHADQHAEQPFFAYIAFFSPHFPLQAPPEDIARYQGKYDSGWDAIRQSRWGRIQSLGLVQGLLSPVERTVGPPYDFPDDLKTLGAGEINKPLAWNELTDQQRAFQATKMSIHAAMVDRMDQEIGRVVAQLRAMNALDNTLIFFLSDNGASAEIMVRDDGHNPALPPGSAGTHLCLGPGWSTVANTPLRMHKTWVHEGGISTPLIVHWPAGISARGELRHNPGHVIDFAPTILEVVGGQRPGIAGQSLPLPPGKSLLPVFARDNTVVHDYLWWLHEGSRALRVGDHKVVSASPSLRARAEAKVAVEAAGAWELYDLSNDRSETKNLATSQPDKLRELTDLWTQKRDEFFKLASEK